MGGQVLLLNRNSLRSRKQPTIYGHLDEAGALPPGGKPQAMPNRALVYQVSWIRKSDRPVHPWGVTSRLASRNDHP